ncbi:hypothetical protein [Microvirga sp.]|nr:hypothetical protein [Microvirga sp.]
MFLISALAALLLLLAAIARSRVPTVAPAPVRVRRPGSHTPHPDA